MAPAHGRAEVVGDRATRPGPSPRPRRRRRGPGGCARRPAAARGRGLDHGPVGVDEREEAGRPAARGTARASSASAVTSQATRQSAPRKFVEDPGGGLEQIQALSSVYGSITTTSEVERRDPLLEGPRLAAERGDREVGRGRRHRGHRAEKLARPIRGTPNPGPSAHLGRFAPIPTRRLPVVLAATRTRSATGCSSCCTSSRSSWRSPRPSCGRSSTPGSARQGATPGAEIGKIIRDSWARIHGPALVLAGLFGILMVVVERQGHWEFSQTWVSMAFLLWFLMLAVVFGLMPWNERKNAEGDEAADRRSAMFNGILHLLLLLHGHRHDLEARLPLMHPIERLRYVARASGADQAMLVRETAGALAAFADDPAGLVTACRRIVVPPPGVGPAVVAVLPGAHRHRADARGVARRPTSSRRTAPAPGARPRDPRGRDRLRDRLARPRRRRPAAAR